MFIASISARLVNWNCEILRLIIGFGKAIMYLIDVILRFHVCFFLEMLLSIFYTFVYSFETYKLQLLLPEQKNNECTLI